jgi:hypothetical protein
MTDKKKTPEVQVAPENPPSVAGEDQSPPDPTVLGDLTPQEQGILQQIQRQSTTVTLQIGQAEIRKAGLLGALQNLEHQSEQLLRGVSQRLEIPQGTVWRVGSDGKARLVPGMGGSGMGMPVVGRLRQRSFFQDQRIPCWCGSFS